MAIHASIYAFSRPMRGSQLKNGLFSYFLSAVLIPSQPSPRGDPVPMNGRFRNPEGLGAFLH